jgi:non-canonical poly(A) RNA polymerase PAPD5/7
LFPLEKPHHQNELSSCATTPASSIASQSPINSPMKSCDVVESFAAIVATPSISLHCKTQEEPMSYADIAKGKLKAFEKKKSYASIAAAAPKKILSTSCRAQYNLHDPLISPMHPTNSSDDLCMSPSKGPQKVHLDAISVTSSSADTDDSSSVASGSSNCSRMSTEDIEEEPMKTSSFCLGEHTINILEFFGLVFDYRTNGLSIRDGGYIYRLAQSSDLADIAKPALVIEDPIHPDRNVSVASFAFSKVVAVFEDSFYALKYYRPTKFSPSALSCLLSCTSDGGTMSSS